MHPEAVAAMLPLLTEHFGNPSGIHAVSRIARDYLEGAREQVAAALGAKPKEIIFTGGGTEANALGILGLAKQHSRPGHIITTQIEHPAVKQACLSLEAHGHRVTFLKPDRFGQVQTEQVAEALTPDTFLVTVMLGNNEIGTIQPYRQIAELCDAQGIAFHCDAVQAVGKVPLDMDDLPFSSLSLSGHKFGGPKGMGALFVRRGHRLSAMTPGGGQESNLRSGTQNVAGAVGLGTAIELAAKYLDDNVERLLALRNELLVHMAEIPGVFATGHPIDRLPHIASFCLNGVDGESLVVFLDSKGICASTGSACSSGVVQASPVLLACGLPEATARGSLRLSVGSDTELEALRNVVDTVREAHCVVS